MHLFYLVNFFSGRFETSAVCTGDRRTMDLLCVSEAFRLASPKRRLSRDAADSRRRGRNTHEKISRWEYFTSAPFFGTKRERGIWSSKHHRPSRFSATPES